MGFRVLKLYGLACLWVLVALGVYVGVFFKMRPTEHARIIPLVAHTPPLEVEKPKPLERQHLEIPKEPPANKVPYPTQEKPTLPSPAKTPPAPPKPIAPKIAQQPTHAPKKSVVQPEQTTPKPSKTLNKIYYVVVAVLNVHAQPNTHSKTTAQLTYRQKVHVHEIKDGWGRIKKGWVFLDFLSQELPEEP
ncbi:SH3 domain-containing protein [Helicobacter baculiformis]|uniref:SH3 domain-containing protein n=1 Tax=Helicobacter baculiformis TaxID=427351 RepID=A0ABV7ZIL5_9HELI|nr:SH3 domain-containing protein [Helicobacter baculiformis]